MVYEAYTNVQDSLERVGSFSVRVNETDGKAWVAAVGDAAKLATDVGILLDAAETLFLAGGTGVLERGVRVRSVNDTFLAVDSAAEIFNSNKLNVSYSSPVAGLPRNFSLSLPQRNTAGYTAVKNMVTLNLADDMQAFLDALANTGLGVYGGAISTVFEVTLNDT